MSSLKESQNTEWKETYPYSRQAIREAVYNALMHTDRLQQIPIQIWIGEDAIYVSNSLEMISDWTPETLLAHHRSRPTTPHIAKMFYRAGYVENWGRGIAKMVDECKRHGNKPPELTVGSGDFIVKFPELEFIPGRDDWTDTKTDTKSETKDATKQTSLSCDTSALDREVLRLLSGDGTLTRQTLAKRLGVSDASVARSIARLRDSQKISREGRRQRGRWIVLPELETDDE